MTEYKTIGAGIYEPIFKKKNDRSTYRVYQCCLDGVCPVLEKKQCIHVTSFQSCPYGKLTSEQSATPRAKSYSPWLAERRLRVAALKEEGVVTPGHATKSLEFIGDYVWIPFDFADKNERVPFLKHGVFGAGGQPFIRREHFTAENMLELVGFKPRALMGGEIKSYEKESVPLILRALRSKAPVLYADMVEACPSIADKIPTVESITVPIQCIPPGKIDGYLVDGKHKPLKWDGQRITVAGDMSIIGLRCERDDVVCCVTPLPDMKVLVSDPVMANALADKYPEYSVG